MALLCKMICNLGDPMSLRHPKARTRDNEHDRGRGRERDKKKERKRGTKKPAVIGTDGPLLRCSCYIFILVTNWLTLYACARVWVCVYSICRCDVAASGLFLSRFHCVCVCVFVCVFVCVCLRVCVSVCVCVSFSLSLTGNTHARMSHATHMN